jgi:hypothetical protein
LPQGGVALELEVAAWLSMFRFKALMTPIRANIVGTFGH